MVVHVKCYAICCPCINFTSESSMTIILSLLCFVCSLLWYSLLQSLLEGVSIPTTSLSEPLLTHSFLVFSFLSTMIVLHILFFLVEKYRKSSLHSHSRMYARLAVFLGLNLGVLLRCIMFMRVEITQKTVYTSEVTYSMNDVSFFWWGLGGGLSGAVIAFSILIALSLLQGENHE